METKIKNNKGNMDAGKHRRKKKKKQKRNN